MSNYHLTLAFFMPDISSTRKFVLVALADASDDNGVCYPSIAHLEEKTSLDRKTILNCMTELKELGLISKTGEMKGRTKQIPVVKLHLENSTKTGCVKKKTVPILTANSPVFTPKQSQKRDTEPLEPSLTLSRKNYSDFQKRLLSSGFLAIELNYIVNTEEEILDGVSILHCKTKYATDLIAERCSFKLNAIYPKWKTVVDAAAKPQLEAAHAVV